MDGYSESEFLREKRRAIERMQELNRRSQLNDVPHQMPPTPSFIKVNNAGGYQTSKNTPRQSNRPETKANENKPPEASRQSRPPKHERTENQNSFFNLSSLLGANSSSHSGFNLPFLDTLKRDPDMTLILGMILLLSSENSDRLLLLALLYILL